LWSECIWLRIGTIDGLLWTPWWTFGFLKRWGISLLAEWLLDSQEGLISMKLSLLLLLLLLLLCPCHHDRERPLVGVGGDGFQVWRVTANILNKQSRTGEWGVVLQMED